MIFTRSSSTPACGSVSTTATPCSPERTSAPRWPSGSFSATSYPPSDDHQMARTGPIGPSSLRRSDLLTEDLVHDLGAVCQGGHDLVPVHQLRSGRPAAQLPLRRLDQRRHIPPHQVVPLSMSDRPH